MSRYETQVKRPPRHELWRRYLKGGESTAHIAEEYGASPATVRRWLLFYGLTAIRDDLNHPPKPRKPSPPAIRRQDLVRWCETMTVTEIARRAEVHRSTVYALLERWDLTAVDGLRSARPPATDLESLRDEGLTLAEIGQRYGVSRQRVHQWMGTPLTDDTDATTVGTPETKGS